MDIDIISLVEIPDTEYRRMCIIWGWYGRRCPEIYGFVLIDKAVAIDDYLGEHARNIVGDENSHPGSCSHLFRLYFQQIVQSYSDTVVSHESDSNCSGGIPQYPGDSNFISPSTLLDDVVDDYYDKLKFSKPLK